ncbi:MAG TPA: diguanylate cyclase, partial [Actinomycetospora sp.]|nr:diguanylate cyclase [Actinomycetospora sp.]
MTEPGRLADADPLEALAAEWAEEVEGTSYVPMAADELRAHLRELARMVVAAVHADPPRPDAGGEVGRRLVLAHFTGPATVERTVLLLGERLPALYGPRVRAAAHALAGALAAGYAAALRDRTLDEQEAIRRAVLAARQHTEQALYASEARFRAMFHEAAIGIGLGDMQGHIIEVNPALCTMFGYTAEEFTRRSVVQQMHPDDAPSVWERYELLVRGELDNFRVEKRFYRADGTEIVVHLTLSLVRDERGEPAYQMAMLEDVSERHRLQEHLEYQAYHDPLTTLANRARFTERLERVFAEAGPSSARRVGVCFLDLDGFKTINDSLGHHVGDVMLQEVARRLAACAREGELVARTGGDEFVVLVEDSHGVDRLVDLADRVLAALEPPFRLVGQELVTGASIGVVEKAVAETTASELMRAADITLYTAKAEGRGRWAVHDPSRDEAETARFTLSAALPAAVAHDEFFVLYQPLVSLADHRIRGVEALVRWQHPRLGVVSPSLFIGPAEETGVIV